MSTGLREILHVITTRDQNVEYLVAYGCMEALIAKILRNYREDHLLIAFRRLAGFCAPYPDFAAPHARTLAQNYASTTQQPGHDDPMPNELPSAPTGTDAPPSQGKTSPRRSVGESVCLRNTDSPTQRRGHARGRSTSPAGVRVGNTLKRFFSCSTASFPGFRHKALQLRKGVAPWPSTN